MLSPHDRESYSDALRPPPGYRFDEAVAATYTLDLTTLLTVPLHLALYSGDQPMEELLGHGIALLEALRKTSARISVYCQRGRIGAPDVPRPLFSLLEPLVQEARAPRGGAFHPKLWLLRFRHRDDDSQPPRVRALVLSRNLTPDRCWDLALSLDGTPGTDRIAANRGLADLVRALPRMATSPAPPAAAERAERLAEQAERCAWEMPRDFTEIMFHALGVTGASRGPSWLPPRSQRLVVISPFVTDSAVAELAATTTDPIALISRPDELAALSENTRSRFADVLVLDENAQVEDGEDVAPGLRGLHAKAYMWYQDWRTHVVVGSANATGSALLGGMNVELLVELVGKGSRVGDPRDVVSTDHFGKVLVPYHHDESNEPDPAVKAAEERLDMAREVIANAGLHLQCEPGEDSAWRLVLHTDRSFELLSLSTARAWPITLDEKDYSQDVAPLAAGGSLTFEARDVAYLTSFMAFELATTEPEHRIRFVLTLPVEGLPTAERDASIIHSVIRNQEGFVRYLLLLLATDGEDVAGTGMFNFTDPSGQGPSTPDLADLPLLEQMTRAYCRDVPKLQAVRRLIEELAATERYADIVPPEFDELWKVFATALEEEAP